MTWRDGTLDREPHGKALMVGLVDDVVPSTDIEGRWLVTFSEYALIDKSDSWGGWRNPVRYMSLEELGINAGELKFKPMPPVAKETAAVPALRTPGNGLTMAQAKEGLAQAFGVPSEAIEITIRG